MDRKLKIWEMALLFGVLCAIMGGMWLDREQTQLANQVIRLHVIANSDSEADQALKLAVRDRVLAQAEGAEGTWVAEETAAQVGPQVAEKLGLPQVTYAEEIIKAENGEVLIRRRIESGVETVKAPMPLVVTVNGSAAECRPRNAKNLQKYKYAAVPSEVASDEAMQDLIARRPYLRIGEWSAETVEADLAQCGLAGSPTKVKGIENVVFAAKDARRVENNDEEIEKLVKELIANHTIG